MPTPIFPYMPDGNTPILEQLTFGTDVQVSRNGTELRAQVRHLPRYKYEQDITLLTPETGNTWNDYEQGIADLLTYHGVDLWFPLWAHKTNTLTGTTAIKGGLLPTGEVAFFKPADFSMVQGLNSDTAVAGVACKLPVGKGRLVEALPIEHVLDNQALTVKLGFELLNHAETQPAMSYTLHSGSTPLFPNSLVEYASPITGEYVKETDRADFGLLWRETLKHQTQTLDLNITLTSLDEITAFRGFLFWCKGRLNAFYYKGPSDTAPQLYRLNHDAIGIRYLTDSWAITKLQLKKVSE